MPSNLVVKCFVLKPIREMSVKVFISVQPVEATEKNHPRKALFLMPVEPSGGRQRDNHGNAATNMSGNDGMKNMLSCGCPKLGSSKR